MCSAIDLHSMCLSELRNEGTEVSAEKAALQEDNRRARDFKADAVVEPGAQEAHD